MRILVLTVLVLLANTAFSQSIFEKLDHFYVGSSLVAIDGNVDNEDGVSAHFFTLELNGGFQYNPWIGLDARIGLGLTDETVVPSGGAATKAKIDHHAAIYWRPETANPVAKLYGLLGLAKLKGTGGDYSQSITGLSYGGGIGFKMYENWNLNLEYRMLISDENDDFNAFSAGVDYRF